MRKEYPLAIFLHIQKTAGSSIVQLAQRHYGSVEVSSHGDFYDEAETVNKRFISGHFGFSYAEKYINNRFSFTFLRDPVKRIISLYNFCRARDSNQYPIYSAAKRYDFDDFVRNCSELPRDNASLAEVIVYESVWNNVTWQLACGWKSDLNEKGRVQVTEFDQAELIKMAKENLSRLDYVGTQETFQADAREIAAKLGIGRSKMSKVNVSARLIEKENISEKTLGLLHDASTLDFELYEHAISLRKMNQSPVRRRRFWALW